MNRWTWAVAVVLILCVPFSCAWAAEKGPQVGDKVIDFTLKSVDGTEVKTADVRKDSVFLLKFGATWCGWCNKEAPHLIAVNKDYAGKVVVLDVDVKEPAEKVVAHNKTLGTTYTTLLDPKGEVAASYGVSGIPVVIIADKEGTILYRGYYTKLEDLKKVIDGALKEKPKAEPAK